MLVVVHDIAGREEKESKEQQKKEKEWRTENLVCSFILLTTVLMAWTKLATLGFALHPNYNTNNASYRYLNLMYIFNIIFSSSQQIIDAGTQ